MKDYALTPADLGHMRTHAARARNAFERFLWSIAFWCRRARVIPSRDGRGPYLLRVVLVPRVWLLPGLYLHYFFASDVEEELHDHPWSALALILAGGYVEERYEAGQRVWRVRLPGDVVYLAQSTAHHVTLFRGGSWSLFSPFWRNDLPDDLSWGFHWPEERRYMAQGAYRKMRGELR